jgi:hypothetical protein
MICIHGAGWWLNPWNPICKIQSVCSHAYFSDHFFWYCMCGKSPHQSHESHVIQKQEMWRTLIFLFFIYINLISLITKLYHAALNYPKTHLRIGYHLSPHLNISNKIRISNFEINSTLIINTKRKKKKPLAKTTNKRKEIKNEMRKQLNNKPLLPL